VIAALKFGPPRTLPDGRAVRVLAFAPRSTLPLSAACLVANGVREALARLLAAEFDVELIEPAIPAPAERRLLVDGATIVRVRGRLADGFVIVRPADARRVVSAAFGEAERPERDALSAIERATLERIAAALVPLCNALCGTLGPATRETSERAACDIATYFEVRTTGAQRFSIGFGLTRDPREEVTGLVRLDDLAAVEIEGRVEVAAGMLGVPAFSRIAAGATIPFETRLGAPGVLRFGDVAFSRVTCGVSNGRNAATVESSPGGAA
jgi:hypothetical protein